MKGKISKVFTLALVSVVLIGGFCGPAAAYADDAVVGQEQDSDQTAVSVVDQTQFVEQGNANYQTGAISISFGDYGYSSVYQGNDQSNTNVQIGSSSAYNDNEQDQGAIADA